MSRALTLYSYVPEGDGARRVGMIGGVTSLQWQPAYRTAGEIKLICAGTPDNVAMLQRWTLLYNQDTPDIAAIITYVRARLTKAGVELEVRGEFSVARWRQRVILGALTITQAASGALAAARDNLRGLPASSVPAAPGITDRAINEAFELDTVLDILETCARKGGYGFSSRFDRRTGQEVLTLYEGVDRTAGGSYVGYFGTAMQNLPEAILTTDCTDYCNVAVCAGENTAAQSGGWAREIVTVGSTGKTGVDRHEMYVDGSGITHTQGDRTLTAAEYTAALTSYAGAALVGHLATQSITATASDVNMVYQRDYNLGDVIPIRLPELGLSATARVLAVKMVYELGGCTIRPVLGDFDT